MWMELGSEPSIIRIGIIDAGWGAWSTLTGWIQSWIVGTQFLMEKNTSLWELSNRKDISKTANKVIEEMINNNNYK